ncbi:Hpt domain-containing protein [Endozoicomonas sp. SM1973]|uniref:Hpt domain-containing protein n=1 Tax=Spartinivicinus marinus TaxID=2994442 RepID=A0A853HYS5_9GAMM|nr:Hpt domain-containing protein [Spartinivicinus marinus]MCX4028898.1 Hpt domain-containing protein [Spartinivicinus marinus]NYZ65519.1 Hpt domain-containing protein [Spartinivicinus marinus]
MIESHVDLDAILELKAVMEDEFAMLVETFMRDSSMRIEGMASAIAESDAYRLRELAHSMKGSCFNMGIMPLGNMCLTLEEKGKKGDIRGTETVLADIEQEYKLVEGFLKSTIN